jgi:hypothetical protein
MVNHWMQTKRGIQTIRAFKSTKSFAWKNDDFLDLRTKLAKNQYLIDYWFRIRISTVSNIFIFLSLLSLLRFYYSNAESWFNWIAMNATLLLNVRKKFPSNITTKFRCHFFFNFFSIN